MSWLVVAKLFSIKNKWFHNMPQTYHFRFISFILLYTYILATKNYSPTGFSVCESHACFSAYNVIPLSQLSRHGQIFMWLLFQISGLVCSSPSFPGWGGFSLLGVPQYFVGTNPLIILCSSHLFVCSVSNCEFLEDRNGFCFIILLPEINICLECSQSFIKMLYKHGINEKDVLLFFEHLKLREVLNRGDRGQPHIPCCDLNLQISTFSLPQPYETPDMTGLLET